MYIHTDEHTQVLTLARARRPSASRPPVPSSFVSFSCWVLLIASSVDRAAFVATCFVYVPCEHAYLALRECVCVCVCVCACLAMYAWHIHARVWYISVHWHTHTWHERVNVCLRKRSFAQTVLMRHEFVPSNPYIYIYIYIYICICIYICIYIYIHIHIDTYTTLSYRHYLRRMGQRDAASLYTCLFVHPYICINAGNTHIRTPTHIQKHINT
jgi:hypothetical protein